MSTDAIPVAAIIPMIIIAGLFVGYCLVDLARSKVRFLPKGGWLLVRVASVSIGGIVYLLFGRRPR
ncbi:hypothetical protein AB0K18_35640 [Nonomuraea sp. NPDC049421]|uniref:hypothetical protein n=1 Tax=Nonomuraea sp. NPDC049421 TaxID=3155275 RepID=UPI003436B5C1